MMKMQAFSNLRNENFVLESSLSKASDNRRYYFR